MLLRTFLVALMILTSLHSFAQTESNDSLTYQVYYYEGGAKSSEGYLHNGRPDGYWKSFYRNGNLKAEGNRKNFQLEGPWIFYNEQGDKTVEINYEHDQKNGLRKTYDNGHVVKEESFVNDTLQGFTKEYFESGELQKEIPYKNGHATGDGYEYDKDGRVITLLTYKSNVLTKKQQINRFDQQEQRQGLWMTFYSNRKVESEGPYINNLKNGYWKYYQNNGNLKRVEKWVMGELQENAQEVAKINIKREINPNTGKLSFKGAYRNGVPEGVHRWYDGEGNVDSSKIYDNGVVLYQGIVDEQGLKQGPWKEFYHSGELKAEGSYKDNFKVGTWKYYYREGKLEQTGNYIKGMPDGDWTWLYENGQVWRDEQYALGQEDGPSIEYSDSGTVIAKGNYVDGEKDGFWMVQVNDFKQEGDYFEGQRNGDWKYYYLDNDQLAFEGKYENGQENGMHIYYYPNGKVQRRGNYSAGERDGIWEFFRENGEEILTIEYENGQEVKYNGDKIKYNRRYQRAKALEEAVENTPDQS